MEFSWSMALKCRRYITEKHSRNTVASDEIVAAIEVQNQAGDTEYLYLPTDICSMNKVKERLQIMDYLGAGGYRYT